MKTATTFLLSLASAAVWADATVTSATLSQNWPWSLEMTLKYTVTGVTSPVSAEIKFYNGDAEVAYDASALKGVRHRIEHDGEYIVKFDPAAAFGASATYFGALKASVDMAPMDEAMDEVVYKIIDLESPYSVTDVTRGALLDGIYGSVETDFSKIGEGYSTSLEDVIIWTGVTNNPAYKTTKLVMRRIPAGTTYIRPKYMGWGGVVQTRTITNEFYIGVFELTQSQYKKIRAVGTSIYASKSNYYNPKYVGDDMPVNRCSTYCLFEGNTKRTKPATGILHDFNSHLEAGYYLTLPGQEQWICAFRAGTATYYCDGLAGGAPDDPSSDSRLDVLGRYAGNGGLTVVDEETVTSNGVVRVGSFRPNAYGLYDMLGNVYEVMLDQYHSEVSAQTGTPADSTSRNTAVLGGCWAEAAAAWPFHITSIQLSDTYASRDPDGIFGYRLVLWRDPGASGDAE